jgi:hypothetical protein
VEVVEAVVAALVDVVVVFAVFMLPLVVVVVVVVVVTVCGILCYHKSHLAQYSFIINRSVLHTAQELNYCRYWHNP